MKRGLVHIFTESKQKGLPALNCTELSGAPRVKEDSSSSRPAPCFVGHLSLLVSVVTWPVSTGMAPKAAVCPRCTTSEALPSPMARPVIRPWRDPKVPPGNVRQSQEFVRIGIQERASEMLAAGMTSPPVGQHGCSEDAPGEHTHPFSRVGNLGMSYTFSECRRRGCREERPSTNRPHVQGYEDVRTLKKYEYITKADSPHLGCRTPSWRNQRGWHHTGSGEPGPQGSKLGML